MPPTPYLGFGFPPATPNKGLTTSDMPLTRRLILQKARHRPQKGSDGLSTHGFRNYFTPLPGYFSPFPHGTYPLSVIQKYLGLSGGPDRFTQSFTGSVLLGIPSTPHTKFQLRDSHPLRFAFQNDSPTLRTNADPLVEGSRQSHNPDHATPTNSHT